VGEVSTGGEYGAFTPTLTLPRQGGGNVFCVWFNAQKVNFPRIAACVIPAKAGIQKIPGFRVKPGMTDWKTESGGVVLVVIP